ncbi:MAG: ABC transporter ATP-binding protein [Ruminococcus sp.]|nr:ABC transporter ATP-binding protein [Ruminococcus sp.]MBR6670947.1 ABC transporter ATP-binding protein [Ruminococcus sp.]
MEYIMKIENLCKRYKAFSLKNISFSLPKGYIMGFVGQNGSGKTTTIRSILGIANKDSGNIEVFGLDNLKDYREVKQRISVVFDSLCYPPHLKIKEVEAMLKSFYDKWDTEEFHRLIKKFKLHEKEKIGKFSKGMRMKLMVAVALSHKAELIILDEPTSGLDPVARDELLDILSEYISDENNSILFSTHITADLERIADYVTVLNDGEVWYTGTKDELMEKFVVIKGDADDLPDEIFKKTIGFHNYRNGFEAMLDAENAKELPEEIEYEKANMDDILIYVAKESAKNE